MARRRRDRGEDAADEPGCPASDPAAGRPARPEPSTAASEAASTDDPAWPPLVHAPDCDRATLLRRIVGG